MWRQWSTRISASLCGMSAARTRSGHCGGTTFKTLKVTTSLCVCVCVCVCDKSEKEKERVCVRGRGGGGGGIDLAYMYIRTSRNHIPP